LKQWANYLISEVSYDKNHLISKAKRHEDSETGISTGNFVDRIKISSDIANGLSYITIYNRISTWKKGNKIHFFRIHGQPYVRIDKNKVNQDYLGDIREIESTAIPEPEATPEQIARLEQLEKQIAELESKPIQEKPKPAKTPRGSLPKETTEELSQELDLVPEPTSEPEEATPEQIARLEQLEKQIAELESKPIKKKPEEATPEQIARLEQLEKQIAELESKPIKKKPEEATPEQIARLEQLEKQIAELESKHNSHN
jgi:BMFP domain-containing protein YqiC